MHKNLSNQSYSQLAGSWKTVRLNIIALLESRRSLSFLTDMINWFLVKLKKQLELKFSRLPPPPHSNRYDNLSFREVKNESQAKDLVTFSPLSNRYDKLNLGEVLMKLMLKVVSLHLEALRCVSAWPLWFPGFFFLFFKISSNCLLRAKTSLTSLRSSFFFFCVVSSAL